MWPSRIKVPIRKTSRNLCNDPRRYFMGLTKEIILGKTRTWLKKRNIKSEIESLFVVAENNAIRANYVKGKIDDTQ